MSFFPIFFFSIFGSIFFLVPDPFVYLVATPRQVSNCFFFRVLEKNGPIAVVTHKYCTCRPLRRLFFTCPAAAV